MKYDWPIAAAVGLSIWLAGAAPEVRAAPGVTAPTAAAFASVAASPAPAPRVAAPAEGAIEWKETWETTWEANRERLRKELEPLAAEPARHDQELAARLTKLVGATLERFPGTTSTRTKEAKMAQEFVAIGGEGRSRPYLRQLIEAYPGEVNLAAEALEAILARMSADTMREGSGDNLDWCAYAADRLIALQQAGYLASDDPAVLTAWKIRVAVLTVERRYWEAAQALEVYGDVAGRSAAWHQQKAELYLAAGRPGDAQRFLEEITSASVLRSAAYLTKRIEKSQDTAPDFPRDLGLEMRWSTVRSRTSGTDTTAVQALLDEAATGSGLMPHEEGRYAAAWVLADRLLAGQKTDALAALRQAEERGCAEALDQARRAADPQAVVAVFRRYPWATAVHTAMVDAAGEMIRRGRPGLARKTIDDVLAHSNDPDVRDRAQVGLWLAAAGEDRSSAAVRAAFEGIPAEAPYPWMGERLTAGAIQKRLLDGLPSGAAAPGPAVADLQSSLLRVPPVAPWDMGVFSRVPDEALAALPAPLGTVQASGPNVLVSGPWLLAVYGNDLTKPLWWRTPKEVSRHPRLGREGEGRGGGRQGAATPVPGEFAPAIADGRIYTRWGLDPTGQSLCAVAAFDARTGEVLWSADDDPAWDDLWPASDPAAADGRLYLLAVQEKAGPILPVYLMCLDAASGSLLWQRHLGSHNPAPPLADGSPFRRDTTLDQVRYGNAVTVHHGAVYASTNLGIVARCDARDGMVEWVSPYPRTRLGTNWPAVLRRMGASPVVAGDRVIFAPRDYLGVFALDSRTGKTAWDAALVPADEMVGQAGGAVIVRTADTLYAVDAATGRVAWTRRLPEPIRGRPVLADSRLYVATAAELLRFDARTGAALDKKPWDTPEPPLGFVLRGNQVVGVSYASASSPSSAAAPATPAATPAGDLALPLKQAWQLARPDADIWMPTPEAKVPDCFYLVSRGVLECLRTGPRPASVWQRFIEPVTEEPLWAEKTMILVLARRIIALDAETGALRWQRDLPFRIGARLVRPPYLVVARRVANDTAPEADLAAIDLATGRLLWNRTLRSGQRFFRIVEVVPDGTNLRAYGDTWSRNEPQGVEALIRLSDGETVSVRPFPEGDGSRLRGVVVGDGVGFCVTAGGALWQFTPADGKATRRPTDIKGLAEWSNVAMRLIGPYLQVTESGAREAGSTRHWIFRRDDPAWEFRVDRRGEIGRDAFYTVTDRGVAVMNMATRTEVMCDPYIPPEAGVRRGIIDFYRTGDRMWIASATVASNGRESGPGAVQMDVFNAADGSYIESQILPGVYPEGRRPVSEERPERRPLRGGTRIVWTKQAIYMVDPQGLHALVAAAEVDPSAGRRSLVFMPSGPVAIDGLLTDWDDSAALPLAGDSGRKGRLYLAHDAANLYVAVRYDCPSFVPRAAGGASGDWLELGLTTLRDSWRWGVGADARGRAGVESLSSAPLPKGVKAAVRHDPVARELVYEVAIPWPELLEHQASAEQRRMGLSLAVWDEQPGGGGPAKVLAWGNGLAGARVQSPGHNLMYLYPMTQRAAGAMAAITDELPDLTESFDQYVNSCNLRAETPDALLDLYGDFLRRHPKSVTVARLIALDLALRARHLVNPEKRLLDLATKAGVPDAVCRRYAEQSQAYLSQWVYLEPGGYPRSIALELDDGILPGQAGRDHRVYWVKPYWPTPRPAFQLADKFPPGEWYEARIPLSTLRINDVPITGITFAQQGEPRVIWDRAAVVFGGKEEVVLGGALPEGATALGAWEWLDQPTKTGAKTHTQAAPDKRYDAALHGALDFARPLMGHIRTPEGGAYLSQWVWLDPKETPRAVSIALHDGQRWAFHAIWGEKTCRGRYMGPLPAAGGWQELRLPLEWTPLADEPIRGLSFAADRGRAFWDRTVLVSRGKETPILDGDAPPPPPSPPAPGWQPWVDNRRGGTGPVEGKVGAGFEGDGYSGYIEIPHTPALDPPALTAEAWIFAEPAPAGPEYRRWVVAKNGNEETDGHFGLLFNRTQVGAYLNIGGTKANTTEAWSAEGLLIPNKWYHIAMTYDGADLKVYHNGKPVASAAVNKPRTPGTSPLTIARRPDGYVCCYGPIDEVCLYNRALTAEEIAARFKADGAPPEAGAAKSLVGRWDFDNDAMPANPAAGWQWTQEPVRAAKRSHTQMPGSGFTGHYALFAQPAVAHLPYDAAQATVTLKKHVPALGPTEDAWRMLDRMIAIAPDAKARIDLYKWFLRAVPDHPQNPEALRSLLVAYRDAGSQTPAEAVDADLPNLPVPVETVYHYHRRYVIFERTYLRTWQVLGPFLSTGNSGHTTAYPPETEPFNASAEYDGAAGKVRWKPYASEREYVDLKAAMEPNEAAAAYAVCWVRCDRPQPIVIEVGRDDYAKVWVNRQVVIDAGTRHWMQAGTSVVKVNFAAGWNEILVKCTNVERAWGFYLELVDPTGVGPPKGIEITTTPPAKKP